MSNGAKTGGEAKYHEQVFVHMLPDRQSLLTRFDFPVHLYETDNK